MCREFVISSPVAWEKGEAAETERTAGVEEVEVEEEVEEEEEEEGEVEGGEER